MQQKCLEEVFLVGGRVKITEQQLRSIIRESLNPTSVLFVFDFDDTLAHTDSVVLLVRNGEQYILDSHSFANYVYQPGDKLDFTDFQRVNAELIAQTMLILNNAIMQGQDVVVITARPPGAAPGIKQFFLQNGIEPPPIYTTSGSANKIPVLHKLLQAKNYRRVIVYEDCMDNINALKPVAENLGIQYHAICITSNTQMKKIYETIKKIGNKYVVYPKKGGKRLGTHTTEKAAKKQLAAIEISKSKKERNDIDEFKKYKGKGTNPCWSGYRPGGKDGKPKTKIGKSGKRVANCQKINEADPKVGTGKKPKGSGRRLYTDENPKDTVSVKFSSASAIQKTLSKKSFKSKSHNRQSQIINLIHQRARAAYQNAKDPKVKARLKRAFEYAKKRKEASKRKTQRMRKKK